MTPKQRRDAAMLKQQAIVNAAKADGDRALTAEEQAQFLDLQREIEEADAEIRTLEKGLIATFQKMGTEGAASGQQTAELATGIAPTVPQTSHTAGQRSETEAERARVTDIIALCRDFDIDPTDHIQNGSTMDEVRAAILEGMRQTGAPVRVQVTGDEGDKFRERASDALMMRAGLPVEHPADGAGELRAMSLRDLGIECLGRDGRDTMSLLRMQPDEMYIELGRQFYNPTSAFPAILDNTIRKSIVQTPVLNALAGSGPVPWFMIANAASAKGIQVNYLNGQETPTVRRMETPGVLGFQWDIYLDWGIAVRDFRGMAKNLGEKIAA